MHWFGELVAIYAIIMAVGLGLLYAVKIPLYLAQRRAATLEYVRRAGWQRTWDQLFNANTSAIAAVEAGMVPGFPDDVRESMLAAHQAASEITKIKKE